MLIDDPDELAVVGISGDVCIAEGDVHGVLGDGWGIHCETRFFVRSLVDAEPEIVSPEFLAGAAIKAQCQQRFLAPFILFGRDEDLVALDDRRTGAPPRQFH
jgi:hypothetical protein